VAEIDIPPPLAWIIERWHEAELPEDARPTSAGDLAELADSFDDIKRGAAMLGQPPPLAERGAWLALGSAAFGVLVDALGDDAEEAARLLVDADAQPLIPWTDLDEDPQTAGSQLATAAVRAGTTLPPDQREAGTLGIIAQLAVHGARRAEAIDVPPQG
jgi:hypothetical protein